MNNKMASLLSLGAMFAADMPDVPVQERTPQTDWQKFSDSFKGVCKPRTFYPRRIREGEMTYTPYGIPYVRPKRDGEIKGKLAIKAAKRARVRAWKAEVK